MFKTWEYDRLFDWILTENESESIKNRWNI
jgi:hypothetical protein